MSFNFSTKDCKLNFSASGLTGAGTFTGLELNSIPIKENMYTSIKVYIDEDTQPEELIYGSYNYMGDGAPFHRAGVITTEEFSGGLSEFKKNDVMTEKIRKMTN